MDTELKRLCGNCIFWSPNHKEHDMCKKCNDFRNNFVPRDMKCPVPSCGAGMLYYKGAAFLRCPDCGTEIKPFAHQVDERAAIREEFEKRLPCDRSPELSNGSIAVHSKLNGGSKNSRKKKQPAKKKSTTQLYKELAAAPNKIKVSGNRLDAVLKKVN